MRSKITEIVSKSAAKIIMEYTTELSETDSEGFFQVRSSWIEKRVVALVETLPVLLLRGRRVEIKLELQKATGYIKCLGERGVSIVTCESIGFRKALFRKSY